MTTLIFQKNQRSCASFSINVAILFLSFKRTTTVPNKLIDKENTDHIPFTLTFHPRNHAVKSIILKNREHLRDIERNDKDASKQVARHFNLPYHSKQHLVVFGLSLNQFYSESRKTLRKKFIFQIGTLNPHGINECFSFN